VVGRTPDDLRKAREEIRLGREKDHDDVCAILERDLSIAKLLKVWRTCHCTCDRVVSQLKTSKGSLDSPFVLNAPIRALLSKHGASRETWPANRLRLGERYCCVIETENVDVWVVSGGSALSASPMMLCVLFVCVDLA
jgi:hypothetical protein